MCQKMPPKIAKLRYYSLSRQNSVTFCKDFTQDKIFLHQHCWHVGTFFHLWAAAPSLQFTIDFQVTWGFQVTMKHPIGKLWPEVGNSWRNVHYTWRYHVWNIYPWIQIADMLKPNSIELGISLIHVSNFYQSG